MKKFLLSILFLSLAIGLNAAETPQKNLNSKDPLQIKLYAENNDKKIIDTVSVATPLVKIYQKDDWIKVGNPKDGTVGWINQKQYQEAKKNLNTLNVQEIFISRTLGKDKQSEDKLVVYQNGQPVSEKEAKEIYKNMKKQLEAQQEYWDTFTQNIMNSQNQMLTDFFRVPYWTQPAWPLIPVVIIENKEMDSATPKN